MNWQFFHGILYLAGSHRQRQDAIAADPFRKGGDAMSLYEAMDLLLQFLAVLVAFFGLLAQYKRS